MSKNILYNFIAHKIFKTGTLPSGIKLTQKTHTKGTLYYFFELPKDDAVVGEYTLDNHHVSVFAESNGYLDGKSQYHYTAYMKDKEGNRYRLHVYFNPRDGYVSVPLLSLIADDGSFIPVADSEDNHEVFKALAHLSIDTLIAQLRKDQKELVKKLKQEYDVLEKEATELSKNLESNKEAYKDNLDLQIAKLEELSNYTDSDPYLYQLAFLKRQKKSPELQILSSGTGHLESKENKESSTTKESSHVETEIATPDSDGRVVTNKAGLSEEIVELSKQFEHIKTLKDDKLAVALTALNTSLLDLELTGTLLKDLQSLRALRKQLDVKASTTLQNLLLSGKFNEAAALSSFYKLVPESMIQLALVRNNVGLLGFLSEKGIIPPDYNHFSVKDTQYSSMFDYYFKQADLLKGTPKAAEMVANFKELVKNGLSLLEIDSTSGLPFAAVLLLDPKHPLRPALKGKENLITNNPIFLKKLNQVFRAIADQTACSQENKEKIKLLTQRNQLHLLSLQNLSNHSIGISFEQWDYKYIDEAEKTLGLDLSVLENDAELLTIRMQVEQQMGLVLPKMPLQRAEMCLGIEDFYKQAINKLKEIKQSGTIPTVMDFKRHIIQCHQIRLKGLGLINAMLECEDELSKFKNAPGKKAKKIAEGLKARLNALYKDSEDNNTSYNLALDELKKAAIDSQYQKKLAELHSGKVSALDSVIHNLGSSGKHIGYRAVTAEDLDDDADVEDCGDFLAFSEAHDSSRKEENKSDGKGDGKTASKKTVEVDLTHRFFGASKTSADSSASKPGLGLI